MSEVLGCLVSHLLEAVIENQQKHKGKAKPNGFGFFETLSMLLTELDPCTDVSTQTSGSNTHVPLFILLGIISMVTK